MNKILINIDSRQCKYNSFENTNSYTLNIQNILKDYTINCIELIDIKIPNKYYFFNKIKNNNFFILKGIFIGPPPGPDVFHFPTEDTIIYIPEDTKYEDISNISFLLNSINKELNKCKFNKYDSNNKIIEGIYFSINENKNINIINLSKHYNCEIFFDIEYAIKSNPNINFQVNNYKYLTFGYYMGFQHNYYLINVNNNIFSELIFNICDEYIFLKINNYNNIFINSNKKAFAKLNYINNNYLLNNKLECIYYLTEIDNYPNELNIQLLDNFGNDLYFYDNFSLILEFKLFNNYEQNIIDTNNYEQNIIDTHNYEQNSIDSYNDKQNIINSTNDKQNIINSTNDKQNIIDSNNDIKKKKKKLFGFNY